jgi:hypothetical protein
MKTFQEFILEAEFIRTVNQNQVFPIDKIFDNAHPMGPGRGGAKVRPGVQPQRSTKLKLVPANIPMK